MYKNAKIIVTEFETFEPGRLYDIKTAAKIVARKPATIRRKLNKMEIPPCMALGHKLYWGHVLSPLLAEDPNKVQATLAKRRENQKKATEAAQKVAAQKRRLKTDSLEEMAEPVNMTAA